MAESENFTTRFLKGEIGMDAIHDYVDEWHESDTTDSLSEFLGLTEEEYQIWVETSDGFLEQFLSERMNAVSNYLEKEKITSGLETFSKMITEKYDTLAVPCIEEDGEDIRMGYFLYYKGRNAKILKHYKKHESENLYAENTIAWEVVKGKTASLDTGNRTIGEVMKSLRIKER